MTHRDIKPANIMVTKGGRLTERMEPDTGSREAYWAEFLEFKRPRGFVPLIRKKARMKATQLSPAHVCDRGPDIGKTWLPANTCGNDDLRLSCFVVIGPGHVD